MAKQPVFKQLGTKLPGFPQAPSRDILETFNNQHPDLLYLVPLVCTEFTAICPITGQPDFGSFEIVYAPNIKMVESKSLKLYLFSFRNHGAFHEDVTNRIFKDLWKITQPKFMRVIGNFNVRGGIAIKPLVQKFSPHGRKSRQEILDMLAGWDAAKNNL
ncbi:MAG: preQ(1) synthase [Candidatus Doudnabacteria bacterium]|nr:preQ(1) synthase [Candidatus Doudnabacteria bacterium]